MNENPVYRPTSGATADELAAQLRGIRTHTRRVTDDLSMRQLMGPMLPVVNPILWEIGHVGWFHEYWTLRHAHGDAPVLDRADRLWNSSTVAHATRWDLDLPDRNGVFGYLADVLAHQLDRLGGGIERPACYFYDLSIRHEDMHVEALVYTRQTLGYARPESLGEPATHRAGAWGGDVEVPGGRWRLGSTAGDGFIFDNEKWAHEVEIAPFRIAKAPVTNAEFAPFIESGGYRRREFWSAAGWAWRERLAAERPAPAGHLDVARPRAGAMRCRTPKTFRPRISERLSRIDERLHVHILVPDRKVVEIAGWELDPAAETVELMLEHVRQISEHAVAVGQVQIPAGRMGDRARIPQPVRAVEDRRTAVGMTKRPVFMEPADMPDLPEYGIDDRQHRSHQLLH